MATTSKFRRSWHFSQNALNQFQIYAFKTVGEQVLIGIFSKTKFAWTFVSAQSGIVRFEMGKDWPTFHPHEFAQTHIGQRRLPPLSYRPLV